MALSEAECLVAPTSHADHKLLARAQENPSFYQLTKEEQQRHQMVSVWLVFKLEGFWLLANHRNHCFANAVLQCLHWSIRTLGEGILQEALEVSRLGVEVVDIVSEPDQRNDILSCCDIRNTKVPL